MHNAINYQRFLSFFVNKSFNTQIRCVSFNEGKKNWQIK